MKDTNKDVQKAAEAIEENERYKKWTHRYNNGYVIMITLPKEKLDDINLGDCIMSVFKDEDVVIQAVLPFSDIAGTQWKGEEWISVKDRLPTLPPKYYDKSLDTWVTPVTSRAIVFDGYDVFEETFDENGFRDESITHWQHLPAPPPQQIRKQSLKQ